MGGVLVILNLVHNLFILSIMLYVGIRSIMSELLVSVIEL
jgi:hypothetical protein